MKFKNILVAYDGSEISKAALNKGIEMAKENEGALHVMHVYQFPAFVFGEAFVLMPSDAVQKYYDNANEIIAEAGRKIDGLPDAHTALKQGQPAVVILKYAEEVGSDLIILGSRGLTGIKEFMLGSVSHNVVQHAEVPVLIMK